jgi:hypothetical protein
MDAATANANTGMNGGANMPAQGAAAGTGAGSGAPMYGNVRSASLYVGDLAPSTTESQLFEAFSQVRRRIKGGKRATMRRTSWCWSLWDGNGGVEDEDNGGRAEGGREEGKVLPHSGRPRLPFVSCSPDVSP